MNAKTKVVTPVRYQPVVYCGGRLLGLGTWAWGKRWRTAERAERAEREGARLARQYCAATGDSPILEILQIKGR